MKKTILVINNSSQTSGAEFSLLALLNDLKDHYEVIVAIPQAGDLQQKLASLNYTVEYFKMDRFARKNSMLGQLRYFVTVFATSLAIVAYIRKNTIHLVYLNSNQSAVYSLFIRVFTKTKIIWHARDLLKSKLVAKLLAMAAHQIICVSKYIYDLVPVDERKKAVVYNGIDPTVWKPLPKAQHPAFTLLSTKKKILVGNIGQLIPWKNHMDLLKVIELVCAKTDHVHFLIVGDDLFGQHPQYVTQLKETAKNKHIDKHLTFPGNQPDILHYMNHIDILIHCAVNEPFGRVVMEAMALQKPVVAYRSGGIMELVINNKTGFLVHPYDHVTMAQKLELLIENETLRTEFGLQARKEIEQKFPVNLYTSKIQTIIHQLVSGR